MCGAVIGGRGGGSGGWGREGGGGGAGFGVQAGRGANSLDIFLEWSLQSNYFQRKAITREKCSRFQKSCFFAYHLSFVYAELLAFALPLGCTS